LSAAIEKPSTRVGLGVREAIWLARGSESGAVFSGGDVMTTFSYKKCTVSEVMEMSDGYGFTILTERAQPILSLAFETKDDAAQARAEVAIVIAKAVEITRPALTAAGEP
jgi:hypothetical protein